MRILEVLSRYRNDYSAKMICEYCGNIQIDNYGYEDNNYHTNVIPKMHCETCKKCRIDTVSVVQMPPLPVPVAVDVNIK